MTREKKRHGISGAPQLTDFTPSTSGPQRRPWEILLCGDLTENQGDLLNRLLDVPANSAGILYFDSCGGSVYTGIALATLMKTRGLHASGVVVSECSSAALLPFAACRQRFVTAHSTLLFHPMRWQSEEDVRLEEATEWARHFKALESDLDALLMKLFPISERQLHAWTRPGRFVSGQELRDAGLANFLDPFSDVDVWRTVRGSVSNQHESS
jgi:ATP-dependent Clp protease protease subunit